MKELSESLQNDSKLPKKDKNTSVLEDEKRQDII